MPRIPLLNTRDRYLCRPIRGSDLMAVETHGIIEHTNGYRTPATPEQFNMHFHYGAHGALQKIQVRSVVNLSIVNALGQNTTCDLFFLIFHTSLGVYNIRHCSPHQGHGYLSVRMVQYFLKGRMRACSTSHPRPPSGQIYLPGMASHSVFFFTHGCTLVKPLVYVCMYVCMYFCICE